MANRILAGLDREWAELQASPAARAALPRWSEAEPALAGFACLGDILVERQANPEVAPAILAALARLAASDKLAARTLLQALVPGLVALARGPLAGDRTCLDELVSLAWERIRTYPTRRPGSVAANVLYDVRKNYLAHRAIEAPTVQLCADRSALHAPSAEEAALGRTCLAEVLAAHRRGVISDVAMDLIVRTRLDGISLAKAAAEHHASVEWANCVRWRAERRLRPLVAEAS
ncbi:MAG: hypothetical protein M3P53_08985 [Actinomycetota bacterium]|nr:hypothetical protein [Actinomycetota bacterium]